MRRGPGDACQLGRKLSLAEPKRHGAPCPQMACFPVRRRSEWPDCRAPMAAWQAPPLDLSKGLTEAGAASPGDAAVSRVDFFGEHQIDRQKYCSRSS